VLTLSVSALSDGGTSELFEGLPGSAPDISNLPGAGLAAEYPFREATAYENDARDAVLASAAVIAGASRKPTSTIAAAPLSWAPPDFGLGNQIPGWKGVPFAVDDPGSSVAALTDPLIPPNGPQELGGGLPVSVGALTGAAARSAVQVGEAAQVGRGLAAANEAMAVAEEGAGLLKWARAGLAGVAAYILFKPGKIAAPPCEFAGGPACGPTGASGDSDLGRGFEPSEGPTFTPEPGGPEPKPICGNPPVNGKYAGKELALPDYATNLMSELLGHAVPNAVSYRPDGSVAYEPFAKRVVEVDGLTGTSADQARAYKKAGIDAEAAKKMMKDWVWHHDVDCRTMLLVPRILQPLSPHTGGAAKLRCGECP